jgi:hypothetical protein
LQRKNFEKQQASVFCAEATKETNERDNASDHFPNIGTSSSGFEPSGDER